MSISSPGKPNIVLILADDMGYGDIGAFGNPDVETPALDKLASNGIRLTQHYSGSCVCAPARAALMTARYPHRTGAIDTLEGRGADRLALREVTVADALKSAGYATGLMGKWHLGALDPRYHPNRRGFDEFAGFRGGWSDYWQWRLDRNGVFEKADGRYLTDVFTEEAVQFIERHRREPFFLHVSYNAPHFPLQAAEGDIAPFRDKEKFGDGVCTLYGMNRCMDRGIARILETLDRHGLTENTLVLFMSDNGPAFRWHDIDCRRYNGHFNGSKGNTYEGGIRVPAILRWPAGMQGGQELHDLFHFTDWMPTLLSIAGANSPGDLPIDGQCALPALRGEKGQVAPVRFWQWNRYTPVGTSNAAMRDGDWKLLRPIIPETLQMDPEDAKEDGQLKYEPESITEISRRPEPERHVSAPPPPLLFNLAEDPYEQNDLAAAEPGRVHSMQRALDTWFEEVEAERSAIQD
ncbi:MAG: sulfatase-like hydrolase/transferase [Nitrospiraceae bacterium]|nr:sulfatase-like hydrolase/transferase [Nitrospiraceae bacterium]